MQPVARSVLLAVLMFVSTVLAQAPTPAKPASELTTISGLVMSTTTGKPVAGMRVYVDGSRAEASWPLAQVVRALDRIRSSDGKPCAVTDADGHYTLLCQISVAQRCMLTLVTIQPCQPAHVALYRGESVSAPTIWLHSAGTELYAASRVVDPEGKPVTRAEVLSIFADKSATTDEAGRVTLPAGRWFLVAQGFETKMVVLEPNAWEPTIRLVRCQAVSGKVLDAEGNPVRNAFVYAQPHPSLKLFPERGTIWPTRVDGEGRFVVSSLPEKSKPLWLFVVHEGQIVSAPQKADAGQTNVVLTTFDAAELQVTVNGPDGLPLPGVRVRIGQKGDVHDARARWAMTDGEGRACFVKAAVGQTQISIDRTEPLQYRLPSSEVRVERGKLSTCALQIKAPQGRYLLAGRLVGIDGQPIRHAQIAACYLREANGGEPQAWCWQMWTEQDGRFAGDSPYSPDELTFSMPWGAPKPDKVGTVRLAVRLGDYGYYSWLDETFVWPGAVRQHELPGIVLKLPEERTVAVKAVRPGSPAPKVRLESAVDEQGRRVALKHPVDRSLGSTLQVQMRHTGAFALLLTDELGQSAQIQVAADGRFAPPLEASFPPARRIEFSVVDDQDRPIPELELFGRTANTFILPHATTDQAGTAVIELSCAAVGKYLLYKKLSYEATYVEVSEGKGDIHPRLKLRSADAAIAGQLIGDFESAQAQLQVGLGELRFEVPLKVDEKGRFRQSVPAGAKLSVVALAGDGRRVQTAEQIPTAGQTLELNLVVGPVPAAQPALQDF